MNPGSKFTEILKFLGKDGRYLVLAVGPFAFANLSDDFGATFLDELAPLRRFTAGTLARSSEARVGNEPAYFGMSFWSLGSFCLGKAYSGMFSRCAMRCYPIFLDSLLVHGSDDFLNAFTTDPRHGRYCGRYFPGA